MDPRRVNVRSEFRRHVISIMPYLDMQLDQKVGLPVAAMRQKSSSWVIVEDAIQASESEEFSKNSSAARLFPRKRSETTLLTLSPGCTILKLTSRVGLKLAAGWVTKVRKKSLHKERAENTHAQDRNHGVVALAVLVRTRGCVFGPASVESICCHDTTQVAKTRDKSGGGSN
jgi:hypothetical protein